MQKVKWISAGDLNAFFGLMLDNLLNLVILSGILAGAGYPMSFIYSHIIPGTALGVMFGDLAYTLMAIKLARKEGRDNVTAMPLGLDTPSTIGIALIVLVPVWLNSHDPVLTWQVGIATLFFIGIVKVIFSFFGDWVRKNIPKAGLLGSIAGIGLALLCFLPLLEIFSLPLVGVVALGIVIYALVAKLKILWKIPGAFAAVIVATIIFHLTGIANIFHSNYEAPHLTLNFFFPQFTLSFFSQYPLAKAFYYLPLAIPFGLLTIVGGINVTESAKVAGDNFKTRDILLTEAVATLIAAFSGGLAQSTPYIGHPAYKQMGARSGYTLATGIFIGLGGILGYIQFVLQLIPAAAVTPILVFVGLEIVNQAYKECESKHYPAITLSFLPIIAELVRIVSGQFGIIPSELTGMSAQKYQTLTILAHGFIITAMMWGGIVASLIDKNFIKSALLLFITSLFTLFGLIHSIDPDGKMYLPWQIVGNIQWILPLTYLILGIIVYISSYFNKSENQSDLKKI